MTSTSKPHLNLVFSALFSIACASAPATPDMMSSSDGGGDTSCSGCSANQVCIAGSCQDLPSSCPCPKESYCDITTNTCKRGCVDSSNCSTGRCCDTATRTCTTGCKDLSSCMGVNAPGSTYELATASILLPRSADSARLDFDGDGRPENQFAQVASVLGLLGLDFATAVNDAVAAGAYVDLVSVTSADLSDSSCAGVQLNMAKPYGMGQAPPRFDGSDTFTPLSSMGADLRGQISGNALTTTLPPKLTADKERSLKLQLGFGDDKFAVTLRGVYLQGTVSQVGSLAYIKQGQIFGVISQADIDSVLMPAVAGAVTRMIHADPNSSNAKALISLFETNTGPSATKCMVSADCCHTSPMTCKILPTEVQASPLGTTFRSDVQVLDHGTKWSPVPGGKSFNAMSVGFGFTAITAKY